MVSQLRRCSILCGIRSHGLRILPGHPPPGLLQALVRGHVGLGVVAAHAEEDLLQRRHRDAEELQAVA